jgi:hypothetical protein
MPPKSSITRPVDNDISGDSVWDHPSDAMYVELYRKKKAEDDAEALVRHGYTDENYTRSPGYGSSAQQYQNSPNQSYRSYEADMRQSSGFGQRAAWVIYLGASPSPRLLLSNPVSVCFARFHRRPQMSPRLRRLIELST